MLLVQVTEEFTSVVFPLHRTVFFTQTHVEFNENAMFFGRHRHRNGIFSLYVLAMSGCFHDKLRS